MENQQEQINATLFDLMKETKDEKGDEYTIKLAATMDLVNILSKAHHKIGQEYVEDVLVSVLGLMVSCGSDQEEISQLFEDSVKHLEQLAQRLMLSMPAKGNA